MNSRSEVRLDVSGLGIIIYSPSLAAGIRLGEDYLSRRYMTGDQVQEHIQEGSIVGFGTSSPGTYILRFQSGYPQESVQIAAQYVLRVAVRVVDGCICVRDLYDLAQWDPACPLEQQVALPNGIYHVTLCSSLPDSGIVGDNQVIDVFLQALDKMPKLNPSGVPTLIY